MVSFSNPVSGLAAHPGRPVQFKAPPQELPGERRGVYPLPEKPVKITTSCRNWSEVAYWTESRNNRVTTMDRGAAALLLVGTQRRFKAEKANSGKGAANEIFSTLAEETVLA